MPESEVQPASWGGRRHGKSADEHLRDGTFRRDRHDPTWRARGRPPELDDPAAYVAERIGLSPRMAALRPDLAERFETVSAGVHLDRFGQFFCRHTRTVPSGPPLGSPFALEPFQLEWAEEALAVDDEGRRLYSFVGLVIPRKNGKTTLSAMLALYMASPADGEHRPEVILAASALKQTGKLWDHATAFIDDPQYGSEELRQLFFAQANVIQCPSVSGQIVRVAGDGDSNHSLDPHALLADELHTWKTPKQRENWKALTTAQGGRVDPLTVFISTEGEGDDNELAALLERIEASPGTEREQRTPFLTVWRNPEARELVFRYAVPSTATLDDLDAFEAANPAPWRTAARLKENLVETRVDTATKMRLYGNRRGSGGDRWIADDAWESCRSPLEPPEGEIVTIGVDAARTRDTTACSWSWRDPDSGVIVQRWRVWSCVDGLPAHVLVPGGRLDNDLVRDFIRDVLMVDFTPRLLFFDERYFDTQSNDLSADGLHVVEMHQGKPEMQAAWDGYYDAIYGGKKPMIAHDGDWVVGQHVRNAVGVKTERGWKVSKVRSERKIDALAAGVMSWYAAAHFESFAPAKRKVFSV